MPSWLMSCAMLASVEFAVVATFSVAPPPTCTVMLPAAAAKVPVLAPVTTLVAGVASDFLSYSLIESMLTAMLEMLTTPPAREKDDTTDFEAL